MSNNELMKLVNKQADKEALNKRIADKVSELKKQIEKVKK